MDFRDNPELNNDEEGLFYELKRSTAKRSLSHIEKGMDFWDTAKFNNAGAFINSLEGSLHLNDESKLANTGIVLNSGRGEFDFFVDRRARRTSTVETAPTVSRPSAARHLQVTGAPTSAPTAAPYYGEIVVNDAAVIDNTGGTFVNEDAMGRPGKVVLTSDEAKFIGDAAIGPIPCDPALPVSPSNCATTGGASTSPHPILRAPPAPNTPPLPSLVVGHQSLPVTLARASAADSDSSGSDSDESGGDESGGDDDDGAPKTPMPVSAPTKMPASAAPTSAMF